MTPTRRIVIALLGTSLVLLFLWFGFIRQTRKSSLPSTEEHQPFKQAPAVDPPDAELPPPHTEAADRYVPVEPHITPDSRLRRISEGRVEFLPAIEVSRRIPSAESEIESLQHLETLLAQFRFAYGANPVGVDNFEITEQLLGNNPKGVVFLSRENPAVEGDELVDRWGTPYFFHALSAELMELGSAGPDRTFWTDDDIFIRYD